MPRTKKNLKKNVKKQSNVISVIKNRLTSKKTENKGVKWVRVLTGGPVAIKDFLITTEFISTDRIPEDILNSFEFKDLFDNKKVLQYVEKSVVDSSSGKSFYPPVSGEIFSKAIFSRINNKFDCLTSNRVDSLSEKINKYSEPFIVNKDNSEELLTDFDHKFVVSKEKPYDGSASNVSDIKIQPSKSLDVCCPNPYSVDRPETVPVISGKQIVVISVNNCLNKEKVKEAISSSDKNTILVSDTPICVSLFKMPDDSVVHIV